MTYRVTISAQAEADLRGIYEYIAFKLRSAINAAGQLERLEKAISGLDTMPERYALYGTGKWTERGLRKMPVDNYLVYYIPDKDTLTVRRTAAGDLNSRRDPDGPPRAPLPPMDFG